MATRRFRGDPSLTSGTISCAKDTLSHLVKRGRRLRIWTGACSSSRVERCPTTVSPDTAGEADTRSPATVTRLVKTTVSTNSWPESKSLLWRGVLDVPGYAQRAGTDRAFRNKVSPRDSAVIASNWQSDGEAFGKFRCLVRHCTGTRKQQTPTGRLADRICFARIRTIAVCLLCVRGIPPTVEAARTGQSTAAKLQAHPSYPQVNTELTKSSGPKGKMAPGNLVLPKNALHSGAKRGTSHFPAGAAHRCDAGPRPPITLVACAGG